MGWGAGEARGEWGGEEGAPGGGGEEGGGAARRRRRAYFAGGAPGDGRAREPDGEARAALGRVPHLERAPVPLDDPVRHEEPEAGPAVPRREERLEDPVADPRGPRRVPRRGPRARRGRPRSAAPRRPPPPRPRPAARSSSRLSATWCNWAASPSTGGTGSSSRRTSTRSRWAAGPAVRRTSSTRPRRSTGASARAPGRATSSMLRTSREAASRGPLDHGEVLGDGRVAVVGAGALHAPDDAAEEVVELVGEAARQRAERRHLRGLHEAVLRRAQLVEGRGALGQRPREVGGLAGDLGLEARRRAGERVAHAVHVAREGPDLVAARRGLPRGRASRGRRPRAGRRRRAGAPGGRRTLRQNSAKASSAPRPASSSASRVASRARRSADDALGPGGVLAAQVPRARVRCARSRGPP